jgi:hypothetical protein
VRTLLVGVATVFAAGTAAAQKPFEGTINYDVAIGEKQMQVIVSTRGRKARQELDIANAPEASRGNYQVIDFQTGDVTVLFPTMKRFMLLRSRARFDPDQDTPSETDRASATARTETIAGIECTVYTMTSRPGNEWCLTTASGRAPGLDEVPGVTGVGSGAGPAGDTMSGILRAVMHGTIVLRARMTDGNGQVMNVVATKVNRSTPPASLFVIPAGFEEIQSSIVPRP